MEIIVKEIGLGSFIAIVDTLDALNWNPIEQKFVHIKDLKTCKGSFKYT